MAFKLLRSPGTCCAQHPKSAAPPEPELFCHWNAQDQQVSISLNLKLIDLLSLEVMEAFKSIPRRGLEIGGLLLGRVEAADQPLVVIEDRQILPAEHFQ